MKRSTNQQSGVTLVEVLVVAGILVLLAGIGFALMAPAKAKGMETACMANLRQIHTAWVLYNTDVDAGEEVPGIGSFSMFPMNNKSALVPYGLARESWFCPATPGCAKIGLGSYHLMIMAPYGITGKDVEEDRRRVNRRTEELGVNHTLLRCLIHDELVYEPREKDTDILTRKPFAIDLLVSGTVKAGRVEMLSGGYVQMRCSNETPVVIP